LVNALDKAIGTIEVAEALDRPGYALGKVVSRTGQIVGRPSKSIANTLHGRGYGHPVHPILVTIPIGTWTLALGLDLLGAAGLLRNQASERAADLALQAGSVGAVAAMATGLADWQSMDGRDRRVGLVHGSVNATALGLNLLSGALRSRGRRGAGIWASATAFACMGIGGYLGGHLVYRRRSGVDHADRSPEPREFVSVAQLDELIERVPHRVAIWDEVARKEIGIVLVRQGERVHALGARCSHAGGPLDQGWVLDGNLICPWHGSSYDLETGEPVAGPGTCPQPRYEVLLRDGTVHMRREQEPGDHVVTSATLAHVPDVARFEEPGEWQPEAYAHEPEKKATDVLYEHHELMRRMFEKMLATSGHGAERHELMRTLAAELDIHEVIEDAIFYPAVQAVSEDTEIAYAEHGVLADLLAATLKLPLGSPEFQEHLVALQSAFLHHAGSEEPSMFREAERLSDARLRELGGQLEAMLDLERTARFRRAFRDLKLSLLEKI
jgi:nitrite reductase/ring-hydroxylating ferredoxin subunit/uncharacterized membrane protein